MPKVKTVESSSGSESGSGSGSGSGSDSESGGSDKKKSPSPPPKKKVKKSEDSSTKKSSKESSSSSSSKKSKSEATEWVLENTRMVKINQFRGKVLVDIREFYEKDGQMLPGKRGISLTSYQFKKLIEEVSPEVLEVLKKY